MSLSSLSTSPDVLPMSDAYSGREYDDCRLSRLFTTGSRFAASGPKMSESASLSSSLPSDNNA